MINRTALLSDLQSVLRKLEADLLERTNSAEVPEVGEWLHAEYKAAKDAERTAHTYKQWLDDFITQVAAAWVLSCVFARFLEDNGLVDPSRIAGPGKRLEQARDEHTLFFQDAERAKLTDREYLLDIFAGLAKLPAGKDVFGPHNPMNALPNWLGPDAAGELLRFFQKIDSDSGELVHDFTDPPQKDGTGWDTRFLGDLYQDLSEAARKKYALLQTPDFVEEFILDRTLDPALDEFGLTPDSNPEHLFKMIDPACGSGHFLLGSFPRILSRWQKQEPGANIRELVQRTLNSIHGVDINPFAIAIARFRLLLAALKACDIKRLKDAPAFELNLACGDSLYHGRQRQLTLDVDWTDESHYFHTEDAEHLRRILKEGTFHCVVANPPYITPKDDGANQAYRQLYSTCHKSYSLSVPFMQRIYGLCVSADGQHGYSGQITANSFMKAEFGQKLIEEFFKSVQLTHVIDCSGACIPGHNTPTVIIFGRSRKPIGASVRTVMGVKGDPETPEVPREGPVWTAITNQIDIADSTSEFVQVQDLEHSVLQRHPWSIGAGGTTELFSSIEVNGSRKLQDFISDIGRTTHTGDDSAYVMRAADAKRSGFGKYFVPLIDGDVVRDFVLSPYEVLVFPYDTKDGRSIDFEILPVDLRNHFWRLKRVLRIRTDFGQLIEDRGLQWFEHSMFFPARYRNKRSIAYAFVATHNHFVFGEENAVFNRPAPAIKLPQEATKEDFDGLVAVLNCSVVCFWIKQVTQIKTQTTGMDRAAWRLRRQLNTTKLKLLPLPNALPTAFGDSLNSRAIQLCENAATTVVDTLRTVPLTRAIVAANAARTKTRSEMVSIQEDVDWKCYCLYGLLTEDLSFKSEPPEIQLGERAFEIVLARMIAKGEIQTEWFEWHGSTPITEIPDHWPDDYKELVQRRMDVIESNPQIALIEQPEYKRRWNTESWESQVEQALMSWLLDRLESYFDFDGRMNDDGKPSAKIDISLTSVAKLADIARQDEKFMEVAEVYRDNPAFDVQRLVDELVQNEHVPLLPVLRYKPDGIRNRAEWEKTWELQRLADKLRAGESVTLADYELTEKQREAITKWQSDTPAEQRADDRGLDAILAIPVPPKYKSSDFISTGGARYWSLRGKLDVPKERWVSFPHCEGPDGTLMIAWAGYNHLQLAQAISAYFVDVQERLGGTDDPRLVPLLAGVIELLPWLKQWHHEIDPEYNQRMDEVYEGFVTEEAKGLNLTIEEIKAWEPPAKTSSKKRRAKS